VFDALADELLVPPVAMMQRAFLARARPATGPALEGDGLVFSAFKPAESGKGVALRFYNARRDTVAGVLTLPREVRTAGAARLDETSSGLLRLARGHTTPLLLAPRVIATVVAR
jgi:alpha-mannosidase